MIDIKSVAFSKNPCYTGDSITISVDVLYEEDKYNVPTYYKILTAETETVDIVFPETENYTVLTDENNAYLTDENGKLLIDS